MIIHNRRTGGTCLFELKDTFGMVYKHEDQTGGKTCNNHAVRFIGD